MAALTPHKETPTATAVDPVCGMSVQTGRARPVAVHKGRSYWFCADCCRKAFEADPGRYLTSKPKKAKGWIGRYLERIAKSNEKTFGSAGPRCH